MQRYAPNNAVPTKILGVTSVYHTKHRPERGAFIHALFQEWRKNGIDVSVLSPVSMMRDLHDRLTRKTIIVGESRDEILIRPFYPTVSNRLLPWCDVGGRISDVMYRGAVARGARQIASPPHLVYAHFFDSGRAIAPYAKKMKIDNIIALGESNPVMVERVNTSDVFRRIIMGASGVVAVSRQIEEFVRSRCPDIGDRLRYFPNGIDQELFFPRDRQICRQILGLPSDVFIVAFTGHFDERKGSMRVLEAVRSCPEARVLFMGQGVHPPRGDCVLHAAPVAHEKLPLWLCAADVFVLPSLAEGMCNAILEAMACALPLIVSDRDFNRAFLDEKCAIFVDPHSPQEIGRAIASLIQDGERRREMADSCKQHASGFSLKQRAKGILDFCAEVMLYKG